MGLGASESSDNGSSVTGGGSLKPFGAWVTGFADHEERDRLTGFNNGRSSTTLGTIGGIDYTYQRLFTSTDAFVFGALGGYLDSRIRNKDGLSKTGITGESVGVYGVYVLDSFSIDVNSKVDFLNVDQDSLLSPFSAGLNNYVSSGNVSYKINGTVAWVEPTIGGTYTLSKWGDGRSSLDGHQFRLQGGVRVGQTLTWNKIVVEPTLTALLYSDLVITGSGNGTTIVPTDEGKLFEQALFKLNFDFGDGFSSSVEGEVRHGALGANAQAVGASGKIGVRYQW